MKKRRSLRYIKKGKLSIQIEIVCYMSHSRVLESVVAVAETLDERFNVAYSFKTQTGRIYTKQQSWRSITTELHFHHLQQHLYQLFLSCFCCHSNHQSFIRLLSDQRSPEAVFSQKVKVRNNDPSGFCSIDYNDNNHNNHSINAFIKKGKNFRKVSHGNSFNLNHIQLDIFLNVGQRIESCASDWRARVLKRVCNIG